MASVVYVDELGANVPMVTLVLVQVLDCHQ